MLCSCLIVMTPLYDVAVTWHDGHWHSDTQIKSLSATSVPLILWHETYRISKTRESEDSLSGLSGSSQSTGEDPALNSQSGSYLSYSWRASRGVMTSCDCGVMTSCDCGVMTSRDCGVMTSRDCSVSSWEGAVSTGKAGNSSRVTWSILGSVGVSMWSGRGELLGVGSFSGVSPFFDLGVQIVRILATEVIYSVTNVMTQLKILQSDELKNWSIRLLFLWRVW